MPKNKEANATYEELVLKFFAYLNDEISFVHSVVDFLNDYMEKATKSFNYTENREVFEYVFSTLASVLPDGIKRKARNSSHFIRRCFSWGIKGYLKKKKIYTKGIADWMVSTDLELLITGAPILQKC